MVVTASVALVAPLSAQTRMDSSAERLSGADVPASMQNAVQVMVELTSAPASVPYAAALKTAQAQADAQRNFALAHPNLKTSQALLSTKQAVQISASAANQVASAVRQIDQTQRSLMPSLTATGGKVMFRVQRVYNGIAMVVSPDKISAIEQMPGVKAVHPMHPKSPTAFTDVDFLGVRTAWAAANPFGGAHGENVKVGVIDSGLDYVHTNFGGNGDYTGVTDTNPNGHFPSLKVPGGYDFVGDAYNANDAVPIIAPDNNPWDGDPSGSSAGHGTACASLIGGYGVNGNGTTYVLNTYDATNPVIANMKISPGMAPDCKLYPLRVFGNSGATNFTTPAIEWALDPNGDGNFADHLDVVSMSLGSNEGYADDDSAVASSNAAAAGVLVCAASGNAADTYYITSSPASANGILSVAASYNDQGGYIYDSSITPHTNAGAGTPPDGKYKSIYGNPCPHVPAGGLTRDVVYAVPANGGNEVSGVDPVNSNPWSNAANVNGKIAMCNRGTSSFVQKAAHAQASGAVALIIVNETQPTADPIIAGLTGGPAITIPVVMISKTDGDAIRTAAGGFDATTGLPTNSPVNVTINSDNGAVVHSTTATDTMPQYSSRGPRQGDSALKPDITAPAEVVGVATNHTGSNVENFNGTSSATPHMSGIMALLRQLHPTWTVEELNALAVNTATHDLSTGPSPVPAPTPVPSPNKTYGVGRVGAGRVDVNKAATANVVAFNQTNPGYISVSFGVVDVPAASSVTLSKTVKVVNKSAASVTYNITYQDVNATAGSSYTLPASITVGAGSTGTFNVGYTATGSALRHEADQSITLTQPTSVGNSARQYLSEKAGYAVLTPTSGPEPVIRVPLYAAPRPVATMHATTTGVVPAAPSGSFTVNLSGLPINTGASFPTDIISLVKPFELQYASPLANSPGAPVDPNVIKYVGVTSDWTNRTPAQRTGFATNVTFAIDGFGDASVPEFNASDKEIFIDFDFDGIFDAAIFMSSRGNTSAQNFHTNAYRPIYVDIANINGQGANAQFGLTGPTNAIQPNVRDTNSFNNSAIIVPATGAGLVGDAPFNAFQYQVVTFDRNGVEVDETPLLLFDAKNPGFDTIPATGSASTVPTSGTLLEPFMFTDLPTTSINVNYNGTNFQTAGSLGLLLVHMHNGSGQRSDVVAFQAPTIKSFTPTHAKVGATITITGSNFGPGTVVTFFNNKPSATVNVLTPNTLTAKVPVGAISGPIRVSNAAGSAIKGGFTVDP